MADWNLDDNKLMQDLARAHVPPGPQRLRMLSKLLADEHRLQSPEFVFAYRPGKIPRWLVGPTGRAEVYENKMNGLVRLHAALGERNPPSAGRICPSYAIKNADATREAIRRAIYWIKTLPDCSDLAEFLEESVCVRTSPTGHARVCIETDRILSSKAHPRFVLDV